jgi:maltose O-acetyltransferase
VRLVKKAKTELRFTCRDILLNTIAASPAVPNVFRSRVYRLLGVTIGRSRIHGQCVLGWSVRIGNGTFVNVGCFFDDAGPVTIGNRCHVGPGVMFCSAGHEIGGPEQRAWRVVPGPITVGDGSWIGARAVILPGVTVGAGCVIAAGAVVSRDCAPNGLYAGVPAKRVRELDEQHQATRPEFAAHWS